jgi:hypothetical protein
VPSGYESPRVPLLKKVCFSDSALDNQSRGEARDAHLAPSGVHREGATGLPKIEYYLDKSDPDVAVLRRQDGSFVAAFSARGATREGILEAAKEDYAKLVEAFSDLMDSQENDPKLGSDLLRLPL